MNIKQHAHSVRVVLFATRIRKQNHQDRNKGKKGMYFRDTTIGDVAASISYAMRLHAKHVRNIFTSSPGCKLLFNFALLWLNLSAVTETLYAVVIIQQKVANSSSKLAV